MYLDIVLLWYFGSLVEIALVRPCPRARGFLRVLSYRACKVILHIGFGCGQRSWDPELDHWRLIPLEPAFWNFLIILNSQEFWWNSDIYIRILMLTGDTSSISHLVMVTCGFVLAGQQAGQKVWPCPSIPITFPLFYLCIQVACSFAALLRNPVGRSFSPSAA